MDAGQQVWFVHGLRLDLYDVAALHDDATVMLAVAAAELYQAGVLATEGSALVKAGPLPPDAHPVERALYDAIPDEPAAGELVAGEPVAGELARPGGERRRGRRGKRPERPTGRDILKQAEHAAAVVAIRRRMGEDGLTRPDVYERLWRVAGTVGAVGFVTGGLAGVVWAVAQYGPWGLLGGLTLLPVSGGILAAPAPLAASAISTWVYRTPLGGRVLRELRGQRQAELRSAGRRQAAAPAALGTALALHGRVSKLSRWEKHLSRALSPGD
jgi:hypothetical protein